MFQRVVVKIGTSVLTGGTRYLDRPHMVELARQCAELHGRGKEIILCSSGAIAVGRERLGFPELAPTISNKQMLAAVGQSRLMQMWERYFDIYGIHVGQILLTRSDVEHRGRFLNARDALQALLERRIVPIVNENDAVTTAEIKVGDNDNLSALVATLADADLLVALTDREGFMDCDPGTNPDACVIPLVEEITPEIKDLAWGGTSGVGRGGMASKLEAAAKAGMSGVPTIIAGGKTPNIIPQIIQGDACGTLILPAKERMSARKHWMRYNLEPEGTLVVDSGAANAVVGRGKSLLPIGVTEVKGRFEHGAAVSIEDSEGTRVAVGLANYSSEEMLRIKGRQTSEIAWILGYSRNDEVVHADNLAVVES